MTLTFYRRNGGIGLEPWARSHMGAINYGRRILLPNKSTCHNVVSLNDVLV